MRRKEKKTYWKIHSSLCGFREDTAAKQLTNHNARNLTLWRRDVWLVAYAGAMIYRTATKYMRIIYL